MTDLKIGDRVTITGRTPWTGFTGGGTSFVCTYAMKLSCSATTDLEPAS
jgi:hypothetical protein